MTEKTMFVEGYYDWEGKDPDKVYSFSVPDKDFDLLKGIGAVMKDYLDTPAGKDFIRFRPGAFRTEDYGYHTELGTFIRLADKIPQEIYDKHNFSFNGEIEFDTRYHSEEDILTGKETRGVYQRAIPSRKSRHAPSYDDEER